VRSEKAGYGEAADKTTSTVWPVEKIGLQECVESVRKAALRDDSCRFSDSIVHANGVQLLRPQDSPDNLFQKYRVEASVGEGPATLLTHKYTKPD